MTSIYDWDWINFDIDNGNGEVNYDDEGGYDWACETTDEKDALELDEIIS